MYQIPGGKMTEKELRKLGKRDLLELLIYQTRRADELEKRIITIENEHDEKNDVTENIDPNDHPAVLQSDKTETADIMVKKIIDKLSEELKTVHDIYRMQMLQLEKIDKLEKRVSELDFVNK